MKQGRRKLHLRKSHVIGWCCWLCSSLCRRGTVGPVRTKARAGAAGARPKRAAPAKPKTAEELDKELDAFMKDDITAQPSATPAVALAATASTEDVEMA